MPQYPNNPQQGNPNSYQAAGQPVQRQPRPSRGSAPDSMPVYSKAQVLAWQQKQMDMLQAAMDEAKANARSRGHVTAAITAVIGVVLGIVLELL